MVQIRRVMALVMLLVLLLAGCGQNPEGSVPAGQGPQAPEVDYREILTSDTWKGTSKKADSDIVASYLFREDGTGVFDGGLPFDFTWTMEGNVATIAFLTSPDQKGEYTLEEVDGVYHLMSDAFDLLPSGQYAAPEKAAEFFEECSELPTPDSVLDVRQSGKSTSSTNGQITKIEYKYTSNDANISATTVLAQYAARLAEFGLTAEEVNSAVQYNVLSDGFMIASLYTESGSNMTVNIVPENKRVQSASVAADISIGDTIETSNYTFTLNNVELSYEVKPANTSGWYTSYPADPGKVYIHIDGSFFNKSKRDYMIRDLFVPKADYNNGYTYDGFVIVDDGDSGFDYVGSYIACTPLETCHYHGLIECPEIVEQSNEPLFVLFSTEDGKTYRISIR